MRFLLLVLLALPLPSFAQNILVRQSNGDSYYRTLPNETANDNYSTKGNTNPYTGKRGIKMRRTDSLASAVSAEGTSEYLLARHRQKRSERHGEQIQHLRFGTHRAA